MTLQHDSWLIEKKKKKKDTNRKNKYNKNKVLLSNWVWEEVGQRSNNSHTIDRGGRAGTHSYNDWLVNITLLWKYKIMRGK